MQFSESDTWHEPLDETLHHSYVRSRSIIRSRRPLARESLQPADVAGVAAMDNPKTRGPDADTSSCGRLWGTGQLAAAVLATASYQQESYGPSNEACSVTSA